MLDVSLQKDTRTETNAGGTAHGPLRVTNNQFNLNPTTKIISAQTLESCEWSEG